MDEKTLVIIPAFNEGARLGAVLKEIRRVEPDLPVLVIDDGSRDETAAVARTLSVHVVSHPFNLGYGAAIQTGYRYALRQGFTRLVQMDADGQHGPTSIRRVLAALDEGYDLVLGSRFLERTSYKPPLLRLVGIRLFGALASLAIGRPITDATTGFQGLSRRLLVFFDHARPFPYDYPDANMIVRAVRARFRLAEVPVQMQENPDGGSIHVGLRPLIYIFKMLFAVGLEATRRLTAPEV